MIPHMVKTDHSDIGESQDHHLPLTLKDGIAPPSLTFTLFDLRLRVYHRSTRVHLSLSSNYNLLPSPPFTSTLLFTPSFINIIRSHDVQSGKQIVHSSSFHSFFLFASFFSFSSNENSLLSWIGFIH